jgi:hypothetical protein
MRDHSFVLNWSHCELFKKNSKGEEDSRSQKRTIKCDFNEYWTLTWEIQIDSLEQAP